MSKEIDEKGLMSRYKAVMDILDKNQKYIESVGADPAVVSDYKRVVAYMRSKTLVEVLHVLGGRGAKRGRAAVGEGEDFARMSLNEIRERINSPKASRGVMESIASDRFGVSRGGLSVLRSRDALKEKIESLLSNESAHEVISQVVASGSSEDFGKVKK